MAQQTVFIGTVLVSSPEFGVALVSTGKGALRMDNIVIAHIPYNDAAAGAVPQFQIVSGESVVCLRKPQQAHKAYIVAPANQNVLDTLDMANARAYYNVDSYKTADSSVFDNVLQQLLGDLVTQLHNQTHAYQPDTLPGDYDITDRRGNNGLHIGRLITQLRGSPLAYIDLSGIYNKIRLVADTVQTHTITSMQITSPQLCVSDTAISDAEALGVCNESQVFTQDEQTDSLSLSNQEALPFYRIQGTKGRLADGEQKLIVGTDDDIHTGKNQPYILAKHRTSLSGSMQQASALGILSVKSPDITGIHQAGYGSQTTVRESGQIKDLLQPYEAQDSTEQQTASATQERMISDAAINKIISTLLSQDYIGKLREAMASRGLKVSSEQSTFGQARFQQDRVPGGATDEQQYPLPSHITLTDPVTGKEHTYYDSTSFISQEADGSILICDGYGSQIRMSRGNIYISPALDLMLRPGRDLSAMVPRHQSYNSQNTCTINSTSSMYIRAAKDLKVAGATSEQGSVVIQSDSLQSGDLPGGLVLKSVRNTAVLGNNIYIGRNTNKSKNKNTVQEPTESGGIVIDACRSGTIVEKSYAHSIDTVSCTISSVTSYGGNAAITVNQNIIGIYAQQVTMPAVLDMRRLQTQETVTLLSDGKATQYKLKTNDESTILLQKHIQMGGDLQANGMGHFNEGLSAKAIQSTYDTNATVRYPERVYKKFDIPAQSPVNIYGKSAISVLQGLSSVLYQDYFVYVNSFAFPAQYGVSNGITVPGMTWQVVAQEQDNVTEGSAYTWKQQYIKDIQGNYTACYPGHAVWQSAKISSRQYKTGNLKDAYVINTQRIQ